MRLILKYFLINSVLNSRLLMNKGYFSLSSWRVQTGLAGCRKKVKIVAFKMEEGFRLSWGTFIAGCGMKILRRERDLIL